MKVCLGQKAKGGRKKENKERERWESTQNRKVKSAERNNALGTDLRVHQTVRDVYPESQPTGGTGNCGEGCQDEDQEGS